MRNFFLFLLMFCLSFASLALEIDEKLTVRVLRLSKTKKTVLLNRGLEDGLVVGDHAKFFLTVGVIARGVVVKASPTRSIWSIYRIVDAGQILQDKVMNIKIASPLKLTDDPTKSIRLRSVLDKGGTDIIKVNQGDFSSESMDPDAEIEALSSDDREELGEMSDETPVSPTLTSSDHAISYPGTHSNRTLEVWSLIHLNQLSGSLETENVSANSRDQSLDFSIGIEKYFSNRSSWLYKISIAGFAHLRSGSIGDLTSSTYSWTEFGLGVKYHFGDIPPLSYNRFVWFGDLNLGVGTVTSEVDVASTTAGGESVSSTTSGSSTFFSLGAGVKYYLSWGLGFRAVIDYYRAGAVLAFEDSTSDASMTLAGIRMLSGLSYRW